MINNFKNKYFHTDTFIQLIPFLFIASVVVGCTSHRIEINPSLKASLRKIEDSPDSVGILIYVGAVFPIGDSNPKQLFSYERRVKTENDVSSAIHITRDMERKIVVSQSAKYSTRHELIGFEFINGQVGYIANAETEGKILRFKLIDNMGKVTTSEEEIDEPLAVGPSLFGLITDHWEEMAEGNSFFLRFVVAEQMQSYRFEVRRVSDDNGITRFEMKATNWMIGLFIAPFRFEYDSSKRTILTYQGRVPPMLMGDGTLRTFNARVTYTHQSTYR